CLLEQLDPRRPLEVAPLAEGPPLPARVERVRAMAAAGDARLVARRPDPVPGAEPVHERDLVPAPAQPQRGPRADDPGPDDDGPHAAILSAPGRRQRARCGPVRMPAGAVRWGCVQPVVPLRGAVGTMEPGFGAVTTGRVGAGRTRRAP